MVCSVVWLHNLLSQCTTLHNATLHHTTPNHNTLRYATLHHTTTLHYTTLHYPVSHTSHGVSALHLFRPHGMQSAVCTLPSHNIYKSKNCQLWKFNVTYYNTLYCNAAICGRQLHVFCRSQWPRGLRRRSLAARLLRLWVRIPPGAWMFVCCECCVLSGRGLCDGLITRPEESYRLWCVVECDLETW